MTTIASTTGSPLATVATETSGTKLSADFNMFLKMLTAQMQNQDPLDPMDTAQYTQQLVQYSQVEQSIEQNTTLKSILASLGTQNLTQASALIGKTVESGDSVSGLSASTPAQWSWTASRAATSITATITDASGKTVDTRTVDATELSGTLRWDGTTSAGKTMAPGEYRVELKGLDSSGNTVPVTAHAVGAVSDVQLANGNITVTVNGLEIAASNLVRIGQ